MVSPVHSFSRIRLNFVLISIRTLPDRSVTHVDKLYCHLFREVQQLIIDIVSITSMFESKTTEIVRKKRKKNIGSFLAMLFCTLVIVSTIGNSYVIRNSFAQAQAQQLQTQQAPTITYKSPWNNNLQISSVSSSQPLCQAGICNQSSDPANTAKLEN